MSRRRNRAEIRWQDLYQALVEWQAAQHVVIEVQIRPDVNTRTGGIVEVRLFDPDDVVRVEPLVAAVRAFPFLQETGQAAVVMHAVFESLMAYDVTPWAWSRAKREEAVAQPWQPSSAE